MHRFCCITSFGANLAWLILRHRFGFCWLLIQVINPIVCKIVMLITRLGDEVT